jgi:hypothetical protein
MVSGSGSIVTVDRQSTGPEGDLFNMFCGGGPGLGIVTSVTLRTHKIADLHLQNGDKLHSLSAFFGMDKLDVALDSFQHFSPTPSPALNSGIGFMAAPPMMPNAGQPLVMLMFQSGAPDGQSEKVLEPILSSPAVAAAAMMPPTLKAIPFAQADAQTKAMLSAAPRGYRDTFNCMLRRISQDTIRATAEHWISLYRERPDLAVYCMIVIVAWPNRFTQTFDPKGELGHDIRDRNYMVQIMAWGVPPSDKQAIEMLQTWANKGREIVRRDDDADGTPRRVWLNAAQADTKLEELHSPEKLRLFKQLKAQWDPQNVIYGGS